MERERKNGKGFKNRGKDRKLKRNKDLDRAVVEKEDSRKTEKVRRKEKRWTQEK